MNLRSGGPLFILVASAVLFIFSPAVSQKVPSHVAYVSEEGGRISVIDLNSLQVVKSVQPKDVAPRGIGLTRDGRYVVTANKGTSDIGVFDTRDLRLIRRIHVGGNPEFVKMHPNGKWIFVTCKSASVPMAPGQMAVSEEVKAASRVVILNVKDWSLGRSLAAGNETEGIEFSPDGKSLIVANEGQNTLSIFEIATGAMPDGVSFDRRGRRIVVAAARAQKVQFFSADSLQLLGEAPVGQRCWHFTFTEDDAKSLVACGRSNSVDVIDAQTYRPIRTLIGFQMPWGVVSYPRAYGSLDLP